MTKQTAGALWYCVVYVVLCYLYMWIIDLVGRWLFP